MDNSYVGDTPGMGQCFCSGACEELGYCPNVSGGQRDGWNLIPVSQKTLPEGGAVYVAVTGEDHEGIIYVLGVATTQDGAREIVDAYCEDETFLPDWIRVLEYALGEKWDGNVERRTILYLRREMRMKESEEDQCS